MASRPSLGLRSRTGRAAAAAVLALVLTTASAAIVLAAPDHFQVSPSVPSGGWVAGQAYNTTAFVRSTADGSTDLAYRGTVHVSSTDPLATLPANHTFTAGDAGAWVFPATFRTAGNQTITLTDVGERGINGTGVGIFVVAGAPQHLAFVQQPGDGTVGVALARQPIVHVQDSWGNLVDTLAATPIVLALAFPPGGSGVLSCTGGTSLATVGGVAAFVGCAVNHVGTGFWLTATAPSQPAWGAGGSSNFAVAAAPPVTTHFTFTGVPATVAAGTGTRFLMRATDAGGLTDPTYRGTVHFASTDSLATRPGDITFGAADAGSHLVAVTFATGGTQTVTAADSAYASTTGTTPGIVVTGGASPSPSPSASPSASPSPSPTPTPAGALALVASSATTTYPAHVSLTVALAGGGSGRHVSIEGRPAGSTAWTEVGSVTTDATGTASLTLAPAHTSAYRAVWAGTPTLAAATSGPVAVAVRFFVAVSPSTTTRTAARGTRLGWTATVGPVTPGAIVRFRVYERTSTTWTLRGTTLVRTSATGKAAFSRTFASAGRFYMEAIALAGSQNASGGAPKKYITVR